MLRVVERRTRDGSPPSGRNLFLGINSGKIEQYFIQQIDGGAPADRPSLIWRDLPAPSSDGSIAVFQLLSWERRLCPGLIGRRKELAELVHWATNTGSGVRLRLLTGLGGIGKTRLAAEIADLLRGRGWDAGFASVDEPRIYELPKAGLLLILDYPEEAANNAIDRILEAASRIETISPIRILLLTRREQEAWRARLLAAHAGSILDEQTVALAGLVDHDAYELFSTAQARLSQHLCRASSFVSEEAFKQWRDRQGSMGESPLVVLAAAIHETLRPNETLDITASDVIHALIDRELHRTTRAAMANGFDHRAAGRLLAVATIRGSIDKGKLERLARDGTAKIGLGQSIDVVDRARRATLLQETIEAPRPDRIAASLTYRVLSEDEEVAPELLWVALEGVVLHRYQALGRLAHDISVVEGVEAGRRFVDWLKLLIADRHERIAEFWSAASEPIPPSLGAFGVAWCEAAARLNTISEIERGSLLVNQSVHLGAIGDTRSALLLTDAALRFHRRLARGHGEDLDAVIALCLCNHSVRLSESGDRAAALATIREAEVIYRRLCYQWPTEYSPYLARCLNNVSNRLAELGSSRLAAEAMIESTRLRCRIARENPFKFEPELAESLTNLSIRLLSVGRLTKAHAAIQLAVAIRRKFAEVDAARFVPELAISLNNLACCLSERELHAEAFIAASDAEREFERLAKQFPGSFMHFHAASLINLALSHLALRKSGDVERLALSAREIFSDLNDRYPGRFCLGLARSWGVWGDLALRDGHLSDAKNAFLKGAALLDEQVATSGSVSRLHRHLLDRVSALKLVPQADLRVLCHYRQGIEEDAVLRWSEGLRH